MRWLYICHHTVRTIEEAFAKVKAYLKANEMAVQATDDITENGVDGIRYYHTGRLFRVDRTLWLFKDIVIVIHHRTKYHHSIGKHDEWMTCELLH